MSHLQYCSYVRNAHYNQSVRLPQTGSQILVSGQLGLNEETGELSSDLRTEVDQAFFNVDKHVKEAGGKGMSHVYKIVIYAAPLDAAAMGVAEEIMEKWFPGHAPILTGIGVEKLALEGTRVEVEGWAHVPE